MANQDVLKEFLVSLSFKVREDESRRFNETVEKATKGILAIGTALGALEIAQKFEKTARALESVYFAATRSGTAVGKLKDLEFAFTKVGGTAEEAQGLVEAFSEKMRTSPGFEAALKRYGVVTHDAKGNLRDTIDLIKDFDKVLGNKPDFTRKAIEDFWGLNEEAMRELRETAKFVDENASKRNLFGLDAQSAKDAHEFENSLRDIYNTLNLMWESEASKLFKNFGEDLKWFDEYLTAHHEGIQTALEIITAVLVPLGTVLLLRVVPGLNGMLAALGALTRFVLPGWLLSMLGVPAAAAALGAAILPQSAGVASNQDSLNQAQERERFERDHPILSAPGRFWRKHAPALLGGSKNEHLRRGHVAAAGGGGGTVHGAAGTEAAMAASEAQLISEGVSPEHAHAAAAALIGNAMLESGLNPRAVHDNGTGYGIYGARLDRRDRMLAWLAANGYTKDSLEGQARYMAHEAMTRYPHTRAALMGATGGNIESTALAVGHDFESPVPGPGAHYPSRVATARHILGPVGQLLHIPPPGRISSLQTSRYLLDIQPTIHLDIMQTSCAAHRAKGHGRIQSPIIM